MRQKRLKHRPPVFTRKKKSDSAKRSLSFSGVVIAYLQQKYSRLNARPL